MRTPKEFEEHVGNLGGEAVEIAEHLARKVLKRCPYLDEFVMGMGMASFSKKNPLFHPDGLPLDDHNEREHNQHSAPFFEFIERWDDIFKITGDAMRFTRDGAKITDW